MGQSIVISKIFFPGTLLGGNDTKQLEEEGKGSASGGEGNGKIG